ncbi:13839_t:CDS:1, partial [Ambispora leptoticha]
SYSRKYNGQRSVASSNGDENAGSINHNFSIGNNNGTHDSILSNDSITEVLKAGIIKV